MSDTAKDRAWAVIETLQRELGNPFDPVDALEVLRIAAWAILNKMPDPSGAATAWINHLIMGKPQ